MAACSAAVKLGEHSPTFWHFLFLHAPLQLLQASPELMEFGSTPSDCFTLAANSCCSYTANGFQASSFFCFSFFFFKKYKLFSFLSKFKAKNVHPTIFSYLSSFFFFYLTGEASLKDGITYQQMQVSFSERRERSEKNFWANLFQMFNICKLQVVVSAQLYADTGSDNFSFVLKRKASLPLDFLYRTLQDKVQATDWTV